MEPRWEYKFWTVGPDDNQILNRMLNEWGAAGWELVGITGIVRIGQNAMTAVLKRRLAPLPPPADTEPGWHPDPLKRHDHRWWDGLRWESAVNTGGQLGYDHPVDTPST